MEGVGPYGEGGHLFLRHLASGRVRIVVELTLHRESGLRRGRRDQLQDHCVARQRLAAPVLADPGKETMLDLVPFARARRQVADREGGTRFTGQLLSFPFPYPRPSTFAPS